MTYQDVMYAMSAEALEREQRHSVIAAYGDYALALTRALTAYEGVRTAMLVPEEHALVPTRMSQLELARVAIEHARERYEVVYKRWSGATIDLYHLSLGCQPVEEYTDDERASFQVPVLCPPPSP